MKLIPRQKFWLAFIILANLVLWIVPSDVVELIARDRQTLLGRYSREHFYANVGFAVFSLVSFYVDWATGATYRRRWFQVLATLLFLVPSLALIDFLLRTPATEHYAKDSFVYHRPIGAEFHVRHEDRPEAWRTYPNAPSGFEPIDCTLRTDTRGFRNAVALDRADVVVLGDSFAEGSGISDEHVWPRRLGEMAGLNVYNLGMSGYDPLHYLESLKRWALPLEPRCVVCLIYEGNDFRSAKTDRKRLAPSFSKRVKTYFKQSPALGILDHWMITTFGPVNRDGHVPGADILDWLPLAIPDGPDAKHYAFAPKQLRGLCESREEFAVDKHWLNPRRQLAEMRELCREAGCRFVVAFAPTKAHVILPIVGDRLPADKVLAFMRLRYKKPLPEADRFLANLLERPDARESVVSQWCGREGVDFVSLTRPLREAAVQGRQVYFTYDQHWTPVGHEVVAEALGGLLGGSQAAGSSGGAAGP